MRNVFFCALICALALVSCKNGGSTKGYYAGKFTIVNDTAIFQDNATRRILDVSSDSRKLSQIKKDYENLDKEGKNSAYISFTGKLKTVGKDTLVHIDALEYLGTEYRYADDMYIATTYRSIKDMELLVLEKDYSYYLIKSRNDDITKADTVSKGGWVYTSPTEISLMPTKGKSQSYYIMPSMFNSLVSVKDNKKVYTPTEEDYN